MSKDVSVRQGIENEMQNMPRPRKRAVEMDDIPDADKERLNRLSGPGKHIVRGAACKKLVEPVPRFIKAPCEKVMKGINNNFIILGRDRHKSRFSGYGGKGHTKAGMIDIVVGRLGSAHPYKAKKKNIQADPDFEKDSARIYLSQRANIDEYFGLVGTPAAPNTTESAPVGAIGIKADVVRIIGRQNIRLVTHQNIHNSMGALITSRGGIDLIAGNDDTDIQPLVRGNNLISALTEVAELLDDLRSTFNGFVTYQLEYNGVLAMHTHKSPFFGWDCSPGPECMEKGLKNMSDVFSNTIISNKSQAFNYEAFKKNYLSPAVTDNSDPKGDNYICSRFNNTN